MQLWQLSRPELAALPTLGGNYLCEITPDHIPSLFQLIDTNRQYLSQFNDRTAERAPTVEALAAEMARLPDTTLRLGIWDPTGTALLGYLRLEVILEDVAYLGAWMGAEYAGSGIMTDALSTLLLYAWHNLGIKLALADFHLGNHASRRVLEKCGFVAYYGPIPMYLPFTEYGRLAWYAPAA